MNALVQYPMNALVQYPMNNHLLIHIYIMNIKRLILSILLPAAVASYAPACTNLIVGKNASADGSTIVSYSADSYGLFGELYHYPAGVYPKGTMIDIHEWDTGKYLGQIEQARQDAPSWSTRWASSTTAASSTSPSSARATPARPSRS